MPSITVDPKPLSGMDIDVAGVGTASRYASALLAALGARPRESGDSPDEHPALAWARSGLMALTGEREGPPQMLAAPIAACADGVVKALAALGAPLPDDFASGAALLGERAAILGLQRNGAISAGGSCRLLPARDGMLAVNLARREDWDSLLAWLDGRSVSDWDGLKRTLSEIGVDEAVERARLLGLPVAAACMPARDKVDWCRVQRFGEPCERDDPARRPLVVDLSSLWAGPLCGQILRRIGGRVIKVESTARPDGARRGSPAFFDRMNSGKANIALDFSSAADVARLRSLLRRADIVIESARPRALRQIGIDAAQLIAEHPGITWVSISGYGREEPGANWVAFGDDAGVGGGLSTLLAASSGQWAFCADAIADPLTGLHAALAAWSGYFGGGGMLIALSMQQVVAHCARWEMPADREALAAQWHRWTDMAWRAGFVERRPVAPPPGEGARAFGADTSAVLAELAA